MSGCADESRLLAYWLGELADAEEQALEEHLFGCDRCLALSERISDLIAALRGRVPPALSTRAMAILEARGVRLRRTTIHAGEHVVVPFGRDVDLLVHRLQADLRGIVRLDVEVASAADGAPLMAIPGLPFGPDDGEVNLVCQRHYVEMFPPDAAIRLVAVDGEERRVVGEYGVMHVVE